MFAMSLYVLFIHPSMSQQAGDTYEDLALLGGRGGARP